MMQLYILKLLKMQTKYLGRQWRKSNMKTMSAIYQKVRHRLTDDWAYGNGQWLTVTTTTDTNANTQTQTLGENIVANILWDESWSC